MKGVVLQRFLRLWYFRLSNGLSGSRWAPFLHFFSLCFSFCCSSTHYSPSYSERGRSQSVVAFPSPRKLRQITLDIVVLLYMLEQEPMTRSLHTNCTLESALSRIFLFLELRYVGGLFNFPRKHTDARSVLPLLKYFCKACVWRKQ